jgi:hypothetical protein
MVRKYKKIVQEISGEVDVGGLNKVDTSCTSNNN